MANRDSINLLRECSEGVKMGITTIDEVLPHVKSEKFQDALRSSKTTHEKLYSEIMELLKQYEAQRKEPSIMAKGMVWFKTNMQEMMNKSDKAIADLITDGCNTGVKSLTKYLNDYKLADDRIRDVAGRLINSEGKLIESMKEYL